MKIRGLIYKNDSHNQIIQIKQNGYLKNFYFQKSQYKKFKRFLEEGVIIELVSYDSEIIHSRISCFQVMYICEIVAILPKQNKVLYDKKYLNKSMYDFFKNLNNKLFIDIEMTMPSYNGEKNFKAELIQAAFFVINKNGEEIERYNFHCIPTKKRHINTRTKKFLHLDSDGNVSYYKFYNKFKALLNKYKPAVITFGKNDKLYLESSYKTNNLPSLTFLTRFVNLSSIIKSYYELKYDPGLFALYEKYYGIKEPQAHDALEDAEVTKLVYDAFVKELEENVNDEYKK